VPMNSVRDLIRSRNLVATGATLLAAAGAGAGLTAEAPAQPARPTAAPHPRRIRRLRRHRAAKPREHKHHVHSAPTSHGFSIPATIVMCESGGNYSAVNSTTGAGGAYQIMPSTWAAYGGTGLPQNAPPAVQDAIRRVTSLTQDNQTITLNLALNDGGRRELTEAVRRIARAVAAGTVGPEAIDEQTIARHLFAPDLPDPDLLIRTGGEQRLSNFLLWQAAYTELYFTDVPWPEFTPGHLFEALASYQARERRFGGVDRG